jgi:hypothetical protein
LCGDDRPEDGGVKPRSDERSRREVEALNRAEMLEAIEDWSFLARTHRWDMEEKLKVGVPF